MIYLHKEKHSKLIPELSIFFLHDSNYGPRSSVRHTLCLRAAAGRRRMAHLDALKGQAVASGLGSLAASRSHPSCPRKGRGISQALPGLAGICAMSRSLGFRPSSSGEVRANGVGANASKTQSPSTSNLRKI